MKASGWRMVLVLGVAAAATVAAAGAAENAVVPGSCSYTVSVPGPATVWNTGSSATIQWFKSGICSQTVDLDLWREGRRVTTIASNRQNNGIYNWSIPSYLRTALDYTVRVRDRDDSSSAGYSAGFTLLNPSYCGYGISEPGADDLWQRGERVTVRWSRAGTCTSPVDLHLLRDGAQIAEIASGAVDSGSYTWEVPDMLVDGSGYVVRIRDADDRNSYDLSAPFSVGDPVELCVYEVLSPDASTTWYIGEQGEISWRTAGPCGAQVDLELLLDGNEVSGIAEGLLDVGRYDWVIPGGLDVSSSYAIRISADDNPEIFDLSELFAIEEPVATDRLYWLEAAAHLAGQGGSQWRTDLVLKNLASEAAEVEIRLLGADDGTLETTVAAGSQRVLQDVLDQMEVEGKGWLRITSTQPLLVSGRVYSQGIEGTFGQYVGGVGEGGEMLAGDSGTLVQLRQSAGSYRTNLLITNPSEDPLAVRVTLYDSAGTDLVSYRIDLGPLAQRQELEPFDRRADRPDLGWGFAEVEVISGGSALVSASVIDSRTNDAITVPISGVTGP